MTTTMMMTTAKTIKRSNCRERERKLKQLDISWEAFVDMFWPKLFWDQLVFWLLKTMTLLSLIRPNWAWLLPAEEFTPCNQKVEGPNPFRCWAFEYPPPFFLSNSITHLSCDSSYKFLEEVHHYWFFKPNEISLMIWQKILIHLGTKPFTPSFLFTNPGIIGPTWTLVVVTTHIFINFSFLNYLLQCSVFSLIEGANLRLMLKPLKTSS